jgi:hypothetical protein
MDMNSYRIQVVQYLHLGTLNSLSFDNGSSVQNFFGKVKQLQVYKTALTDDTLALLTS